MVKLACQHLGRKCSFQSMWDFVFAGSRNRVTAAAAEGGCIVLEAEEKLCPPKNAMHGSSLMYLECTVPASTCIFENFRARAR